MNKFWGREKELELLEEIYSSKNSQIVVVYGRRRVGKSSLIEKFLEGKKAISLEGLENEGSAKQIAEMVKAINDFDNDPILRKTSKLKWNEIFEYLTEKTFQVQGKKILFLDELQWLCAYRSNLISLLKSYWDRHWKHQNVMLILCGSVASFMVNKVVHSKALYGRISHEILLKPLKPNQAMKFFQKKRNNFEILKYLLILGGIPRYLEEININKSFDYNIEKLCFRTNGFLFNEADRIFYSQFREAKTYTIIVKSIIDKALSFKEISEKLEKNSGGSLKLYLDNLEKAEIIRSFVPFDKKSASKFKKYRLSDEYLTFYYKYIEPKQKLIKEHEVENLFQTTVANHWQSWLGYAFERFVIKNAIYFANKMKFADKVINLGPWYSRNDNAFQIDLVYERSDQTFVICEIKYLEEEIGPKIIPEFERKLKLINIPKNYSIEKALIAPFGANKSLLQSEYFDYVVEIDDIFN